MKLDTLISHLRSILMKEGNLEVTYYPLHVHLYIQEPEESLEDTDIVYDFENNIMNIYIGNLHLHPHTENSNT